MLDVTERNKARKITISLPASLLEMIDELAKEQATSRSAIIAQEMQKVALERLEAELKEAYAENVQENNQILEEFSPLIKETWSEW